MAIDLDRARRDTPGVQHVNHMNNAGAALMPEPVRRAVVDHLDREATIGGYEAADAAEEALERGVYRAIATLIGADPSEIAVIENATRAAMRVLRGPLAALPEIVVSGRVKSPALIVIGDVTAEPETALRALALEMAK